MNDTYRFRIAGAYTPTTLPMERLAEYLTAFAAFLGETSNVHFEAVESGSAVLRATIDEPARPKVAARVDAVRNADGPEDAAKAFNKLDNLLKNDNAIGELISGSSVVIKFPGRTRPDPLTYGPFRQEGSLDGQLMRVGGKPPTVPVHLNDGEFIRTGLHTTPAIARQIAHFIYGPIIRVHGTGQWYRSGDGNWELRSFKIVSFEELDQSSLSETFGRLRSVAANGWKDIEEPLNHLTNIRGNEEITH